MHTNNQVYVAPHYIKKKKGQLLIKKPSWSLSLLFY